MSRIKDGALIEDDQYQKRAERLLIQWHKDCQPMIDTADAQELEDRMAAELRADGP